MTDAAYPPIQELLDLLTSQSAIIERQAALIREQSVREEALSFQVERLEERISELEIELARLRNDPPGGVTKSLPSFVKPNKPSRETTFRKPRAQGFSRRVEAPTRTVPHVVERCPDCNRKLAGGWVHHTRQVIEIPEIRYEVIEHAMMGRHCGVCSKDHVAAHDFSDVVIGNSRFGIRLMSLIVSLKSVSRMTVRGIQEFLHCVYGLRIAVGAITGVLHTVARCGRKEFGQLLVSIRNSPSVQADETSWRENGKNHYVWSLSTPDTRLYVVHKSRGHKVPEALLGPSWKGVLGSDFYSGYNFYLGEHQRCWVHFLRDLKALEEKHPDNAALLRWVTEVRQVWKDATSFHDGDRRVRIKAKSVFQQRLIAIAQPFAGRSVDGSIQRVLADRIMRFANELFTFVEYPFVLPDNNAAERAIRPLVISRKVSGGTRSHKGSATTSILMSLVGTWKMRQQHVMQTCAQMLRNASSSLCSQRA